MSPTAAQQEHELAYRATFVIGTGVLALAIVVGLAFSIVAEHRLPVLGLAEILSGYMDEIEAALAEQDYAGAELQARLALDLVYQDQERAYDALGRALLGQDELDDAARQFRRAIQLRPDFAQAQNNLGLTYARQQRYPEAAAAFREAYRLDPTLHIARDNLARAMRQLGEPGSAPSDPRMQVYHALLSRFYAGDLDSLNQRLAPRFIEQLGPAGLDGMRRTVSEQLGAELELIEESERPLGRSRLYVRRARFEHYSGEVVVMLRLAEDDRIEGLAFQRAEDATTP